MLKPPLTSLSTGLGPAIYHIGQAEAVTSPYVIHLIRIMGFMASFVILGIGILS